MQTERDWLDQLADETNIGYGPLIKMLYAALDAEKEQENSSSDYWIGRHVGFQYGIFDALRHLDAKSETIVEAIKQARREREA